MKSYIYSLPVLLAAMVATTSAFIRHPTTKRTPTGLKALNEKLVATALVATVLTGFVPTSDAALAPPPLVAGVEIVPSGGGGFGGLGISPFGVGPFGGFGKRSKAVCSERFGRSLNVLLTHSRCTYSTQDLALVSGPNPSPGLVCARRSHLRRR